MGTYKHIGRLRSARLIGREVASFYMLLGEIQNAAAFLSDALRTFEQDGWRELAAQTQVELAECYKKSNDTKKYITACSAVSAAPEIDNLIRWSYFDEMQKHIKQLDSNLTIPFKDIIKIVSISLKNLNPVVQDSVIEVELSIDSSYPREILCSEVIVSLEIETKEYKRKENITSITANDLKPVNSSLRRLKIHRHLDFKEDKQLNGASVACLSTPVKRSDSLAPQHRSEFNSFLSSSNKTVS